MLRARAALGLDDAATKFWSKEILYALRVSELVVPPALREGRVLVRVPRDDEFPAMLDGRLAYCAETTSVPDTPEHRAEQSRSLTRHQERGTRSQLMASCAPRATSTSSCDQTA